MYTGHAGDGAVHGEEGDHRRVVVLLNVATAERVPLREACNKNSRMGCGVRGARCAVWGARCGVWGVGCGVWGVGAVRAPKGGVRCSIDPHYISDHSIGFYENELHAPCTTEMHG